MTRDWIAVRKDLKLSRAVQKTDKDGAIRHRTHPVLNEILRFDPPLFSCANTSTAEFLSRYRRITGALNGLRLSMVIVNLISQAAKWFLLKKETVRDWWKNRDRILGVVPKQSTWKPHWPELEDELFRRFVQRRSEKKIITVAWFRTTAKHLFGELYPEHEVPPKFPPKPCEKTPNILDSPKRRFHNNCILNVDETPIPFEYTGGSTNDFEGEKTVSGKTDRSGWNNRKATLLLPIFADGLGRLKPKLIFEGAEPPKGKILKREGHLYHPGVTVEFNPTAYNNEKLVLKWLNEEVIPCKKPYREFMLIMDVASFHKTDAVTMLLGEKKILPAMIPPGCTILLQPLDVSINKPFKQWLQQFSDGWIAERELDPARNPKPWTSTEKRVMTTHIVAKSWERLQERSDMVEKSFYTCGIGLRPDGSEEHKISIKNIKKEEIDFTNWEIASNAAEGEPQYQEIAAVYNDEELGLSEDDIIESLTSCSTEKLARIALVEELIVDYTRADIREELIRQLVDKYNVTTSQGEEPLETEVSLSLGNPFLISNTV
ncbi:ER degradation-enhancing alpha-mannosidase-like protein 1 [Fusarium oxysporum f. sp. albedinis]|nr:ER degradation-enhancing alpha-mannosidase-like protein 1 [Fusarium oxysporum f. sp. albedinis]